jgi:hypothetical protein
MLLATGSFYLEPEFLAKNGKSPKGIGQLFDLPIAGGL